MSSQILSLKEKIGYGLGDAASHIVFDNVMLYLMFFYTDIAGLPAAFVGSMFLITRILDAISDPCMGLLADRTRTRWGKFRPWILWAAIPFGISCYFTYTVPELSLTGKMIYATVTYIALTLLYTIVNIPYCALGAVITSDPQQRISMQSWRFVLATAGGMLSTALMMKMVEWIGGEDKAFGFQASIAILAVLATIMFYICFFTTKERVIAPQNSSGFKGMLTDLKDIWQNDQWRVVGFLTVFTIIGTSVRGGVMMYYVTWIMESPKLFSIFLTTYCVGNILGSAIAKPLSSHFCKVKVFISCNLILTVLSFAMFFVPMDTVTIMFCLMFIIGVLHQVMTPIKWVMMADTVDYGEASNGKRLTGISFAGTLFVLKMGLAVGGAIIGWMLAAGGYQAGATAQSSSTITTITLLFTVAPGICYFLCAAIAKMFYKLDSHEMERINAKLSRVMR
ncbi:glycoside-pentoside-hexuronide (GPH):cation symporter [Pseudocitrobacter corydidari]|uniref:Inner membrane symporter YicJ n=1 Tax=Pseudocitrobacter corydidari TaxID=2891570 RepID=A0ABY3S877_9ENTR|nr:glycoside-pentoside-hexuronide (GPH):cation symporter [Pseudocitrobacter corydidari]UGS42771.1 Inner membrane symporter YicJ [Pseudocitrobacter corydidari]